MTPPSADRLALLRAVASAPEDDAPRLVYADWLDEFGETDADRARAEFIRLGCRGAAKTRILKAEADWLESNWQRLWPAAVAELDSPRWQHVVRRDGRWMAVRLIVRPPPGVSGDLELRVRLECWRGFVRRVEYNPALGFELAGVAITTDEPLAEHGVTADSLWPHYQSRRVLVGPAECGGAGPFARLDGHDPGNVSGDQKVFYDTYTTNQWGHPSHGDPRRCLADVAARIGGAMTAFARRQAGWAELVTDAPPMPHE